MEASLFDLRMSCPCCVSLWGVSACRLFGLLTAPPPRARESRAPFARHSSSLLLNWCLLGHARQFGQATGRGQCHVDRSRRAASARSPLPRLSLARSLAWWVVVSVSSRACAASGPARKWRLAEADRITSLSLWATSRGKDGRPPRGRGESGKIKTRNSGCRTITRILEP